MKIKIQIIFLIVFFLPSIGGIGKGLSQPLVTQEWVATYNSGENNNDGLYAMAIDTSGNVYVTGYIRTNDQNDNFCTIKYNSTGDQQWVAIYNGPGTNSIDQSTAIAIDKLENIYVTGKSEETGLGSDAYCVIKYTSSGSQIWVARYSRTPHYTDDPLAIALDKYGNVYVTGESMASNQHWDYLTIKLDSSGNFQWARTYNGPGNYDDISHSIAVDDSCNVFITGESNATPTAGFCTIKYKSNGDSVWTRRFDATLQVGNYGQKLVIDKWSNVYATGYTYYVSSIPDKFCTLKYNNNGVQQWVSYYQSLGASRAYAIAIDSTLNVFVTGLSILNNSGAASNYATIKYNQNGIQQWVSYFHYSINSIDIADDILTDPQGNVYVTGYSDAQEFISIRYNTSGVQQWLMTYPGGANAIKIDKNNNVYITGNSPAPGSKCTTIKYSQLVGIQKISKNVSDKFKLYQNFPNPFNSQTKIYYDLKNSGFVQIKIFDILGRKLLTFVNEEKQPGEYVLDWNGENYPSGIYFYKIEYFSNSYNFSDTKSMVLIK